MERRPLPEAKALLAEGVKGRLVFPLVALDAYVGGEQAEKDLSA